MTLMLVSLNQRIDEGFVLVFCEWTVEVRAFTSRPWHRLLVVPRRAEADGEVDALDRDDGAIAS
jgi:hypothetical protein